MEKVKEEMLEKLQQVKQTAENDLIDKENTKIQNAKFYGKVKLINKESKEEVEFDLYTVEEYNINTDEIETKIYLNGEEIDMAELLRKYESFEPIKDILNMEKDKSDDNEERVVYDLNELETEKKVEEYAKVAGIDSKEVKSVAEIKEKEEEQSTDNENEVDTKKVESVSHLQEMKGSTKVNNQETLSKVLGMTGVKKFVVVYSEDTEKIAKNNEEEINKNNTRYSMIAIMNDGTAINLDDKLEQSNSEGVNSSEKQIYTDEKGVTREETFNSIYNIKGTNNKAIAFKNGNLGEIEISYGSMTKGIGENEGNQFVGTKLETKNVWPTSNKVRNQESNRKGDNYADDKVMEVDEHLEHGDDKIEDIENADGDDTTVSLCNTITKSLEALKENENIRNNFSDDDLIKIISNVLQENPEISQEDLILKAKEKCLDYFGSDSDTAGGEFGNNKAVEKSSNTEDGMVREGPWDSVKH